MCASCDVKFDNIQTLDVHMKSVHQETEYDRQQKAGRATTEAKIAGCG